MDRRPSSPPSSPRIATRERGDGRSSRLSDEDARLRGLLAAEDAAHEGGARRIAGVDENHPVDGTGEAAPTGKAWARKLLAGLLPVLTDAVKETGTEDLEVKDVAELVAESL